MTTTTDRYARLADRFGDVVDSLTLSDWDAASPCDGWTGKDVLDHVMTTQQDFLAQHGIQASSSTPTEGGPAAAWHAHDARLRGLLADPAVADLVSIDALMDASIDASAGGRA